MIVQSYLKIFAVVALTQTKSHEKICFFLSLGWTDPLIWILLCHRSKSCETAGVEVKLFLPIVRSWSLPQPAPSIYQTLRFDMNWYWWGNTERDNTWGESWQKTQHTAWFSLKGSLRRGPLHERKWWMMITWKCSFTCNTLAVRPQRSNCGLLENLSADDQKTMLRTVCEKNKLHCINRGNRVILYISHNDNWPEDWNSSSV